MDGDERKTLFGGVLSALFIVAVIGALIVAFIVGALNDGDNSNPGTNPTVNDRPFTEPNFDNFNPDGLVNGQR
jgi:hypothetical protein